MTLLYGLPPNQLQIIRPIRNRLIPILPGNGCSQQIEYCRHLVRILAQTLFPIKFKSSSARFFGDGGRALVKHARLESYGNHICFFCVDLADFSATYLEQLHLLTEELTSNQHASRPRIKIVTASDWKRGLRKQAIRQSTSGIPDDPQSSYTDTPGQSPARANRTPPASGSHLPESCQCHACRPRPAARPSTLRESETG